MIARGSWLERGFPRGVEVGLAPGVLSRLRGAPARLDEGLAGLGREQLLRREGAGWSVLENAGHLGDLEPLWAARVEDLLSGAERLTPWEISNEKTNAAGHDEAASEALAARFRAQRTRLVTRLEGLAATDFERCALHQRLGVSMRLIDLCAFVSEHDDHHLARMHELARGAGRA